MPGVEGRWWSRWRLVVAVAVIAFGVNVPSMVSIEQPQLWLWAWERPEDLRFLPRSVGVAFLTETIILERERIHVVPRHQPLRVAPGQRLMAVVRVEADPYTELRLTAPRRAAIVKRLKAAAMLPNVEAVQIDFDATQSQQAGYRSLLHDARAALPSTTRLSMTALASWCLFDRWIDASTDVDEVVVMLFDMGSDDAFVHTWLAREGTLRSTQCAKSAGMRLGERWSVPRGVQDVFVFNPEPWTLQAFTEAERQLQ